MARRGTEPDRGEVAAGTRRRRILGIGPRSLSLSITLAVSIGLLVLVAMASSLSVALLASFRNTFSLLEDKATLVLARAEDNLRTHLEPVEAQLGFLADRIVDGQIDPSNVDQINIALLAAASATPHVVGLSLWQGTPDDMRVTAVQRLPGGHVTVHQRQGPLTGATRQEAIESYFRRDAYWGRVVYSEELSAAGLNLRHPVVVDDQIIGTLIAVVSVDDLSRMMLEMSDVDASGDATGEVAFILYGRDRVLAHPSYVAPSLDPDMSQALSQRNDDDPLLALDEIGWPALAALWDEAANDGTPVRVAGGTVRLVDLDDPEGGDDIERLFLLRPITGYADQPLIVGVSIAAADVSREMQRLIGSASVGLIILVVAVIIGVLVGRRIARPVIRLAGRASHIAETLDFSRVEPLPGSVFTELDRQAGAFNRMVGGLRWLDTYVPKSLARRLMTKTRGEEIRSIERELTIMFTDIEGFTARSEGSGAADTAAFLNHHFGLLAEAVEGEGGTVDKYMGDGMMAFWGAPDKQPDHAQRAVRAALAMRAAVRADNTERQARGEAPVLMRIGIHTGPVVIGNIGAEGRMNYTPVGDAVNTANRLEQLGKTVERDASGVTILASEQTVDQLAPDTVSMVDLGAHNLRGRHEAVTLYALDG